MRSPAVELVELEELEELIPSLRGVLHAYAFYLAVVCAALLISFAPGERARFSAVVYGLALCSLFGISGKYNRWKGSLRVKRLLRRADHSSIFLFIAASHTPLALLAASGDLRLLLLALAWGGALGGVFLCLVWTDSPKYFRSFAYTMLGSVSLIALPQLSDQLGFFSVALWISGLLLYGLGALVYARERPNPWPATFAFHELFHALVILGVLAHLAVLAPLILSPLTPA